MMSKTKRRCRGRRRSDQKWWKWRTFLRVGWVELHQTGSEHSQTMPSGQVCFRHHNSPT